MRFTLNKSVVQLRFVLIALLVATNIVLILFLNATSLLSFVYTIFLFLIINYFIKAEDYLVQNFIVLQFYIFLALLLYFAQLKIMPDWNGFSGGLRVGTDDSRYYSEITSNINSIPTAALGLGYRNSYSWFGYFLKILYPFNINHPLSIIIPNLLGICFIPFYTKQVSYEITKDLSVSKTAFFLVLICPVILSNGLILMRDGWTAFFLIAGLYYLIKGKNIQYVIILILLSYIRLGSGLLLASMPIFYFSEIIFSGTFWQKNLKISIFVVLLILILGFGFPIIINYLVEKGVSGFGRQEFVDTFIFRLAPNSVIYHIYTLPFYLRLPIGFAFFLLLPFLKFQFYTLGIFNIRTIMFTTLMPIFSLFYFKYFVSGFLNKKKERQINKLFYIYFFLILIISQFSLQPRHKTTIMPIFYVLVAYGIYNNTKLSRQLGTVFSIMLAFVEIYFFV